MTLSACSNLVGLEVSHPRGCLSKAAAHDDIPVASSDGAIEPTKNLFESTVKIGELYVLHS